MATPPNDQHHQVGFMPIEGALQGDIRAQIQIAEPRCVCCEATADMVLVSPFPTIKIFTDVQLCWPCYETARNRDGAFPYLGLDFNAAYQCPHCGYILNSYDQTVAITDGLASQPFPCPQCGQTLQPGFHHAGCGNPNGNFINLQPYGD